MAGLIDRDGDSDGKHLIQFGPINLDRLIRSQTMSNTSSIIRCRNAAKMKITHAFHFVELSPWPLLASSGCGTLTVGFVMSFHNYELGLLVLALGLVLIGSVLSIWWRDVIREGLFQGNHTCSIQAMMIEGFVLFILSEVMFFVAWFWAFFHCSLAPPVELGCVWPSNCIDLISTWGVPWFNTVLLLSSGATVTLCHHCLMCSRYKHSLVSLQATIWLAWIFTFWQGYEYQTTWLNISDGNAGSTFFLATGFHGIHVLIGTIFLTISMVRQLQVINYGSIDMVRQLYYHYSSMHLFGFEYGSISMDVDRKSRFDVLWRSFQPRFGNC